MSKKEFYAQVDNIGNIYKYQGLLELSKKLDFNKMQDSQAKIIKDFILDYSEKVMIKNIEELEKIKEKSEDEENPKAFPWKADETKLSK